MDRDLRIAPHESFEIHELLTFKNLCATKSAMMSKLVQDEALRTLLVSDVATTKQQVMELKTLLEASSMKEPEMVKNPDLLDYQS